jgi:hypothetical protein
MGPWGASEFAGMATSARVVPTLDESAAGCLEYGTGSLSPGEEPIV